MGRRWMAALPSAAVVAALAVVAAPSSSQAGTINFTFDYTGGPQTWVVPAGVTQATFNVVGAQGGSAGGLFGVPNPGGFGGRAVATLTVTPGQTINIFVGGKGADWQNSLSCDDRAGGFNGGGDAGVNNTEVNFCGQGGGGASDLRIDGVELSNRVLVAGGGGGGAVNALCPGAGGGGGLTGESADANDLCTQGGTGGDQTGSSGSGQLGIGSAGGDSSGGIEAPGGGGGGGYYGGSGGQADGHGGGGGSGFGPGGTEFETGVNQGNGSVGISVGADMEPLPDTGPGSSTTILVVGLALLMVGVVLVRLPQRRPPTASR